MRYENKCNLESNSVVVVKQKRENFVCFIDTT